MNERPGTESKALQIGSWICSLLASLYFVWAYTQLSSATKIFVRMFEEMSVQLPTRTLFLVNNYHLLYPMLFLGTGVLVVAKEVFIRDKKLSLAITFLVFLAVLNAVFGINRALYAPVFMNQ
jgi:hypothetical protein